MEIVINSPKYGTHVVEFDDSDAGLVLPYKWCIFKARHCFYAVNGSTGLLMHRLIMNPKKGKFIDHKDRNGLNNKRSNLRECTNSQNIVESLRD